MCGASAAQASNLCSSTCGKNPTESQLTCLEGAACATDPTVSEKACGIGTTSAADAGEGEVDAGAGTACLGANVLHYSCQCSPSNTVKGCTSADACMSLCRTNCTAASACVRD